MTNQTLFELMSEIDFDLVERAEAPVPVRKKPIFRVAMIAAALVLVLTAFVGVASVAYTVDAVHHVRQNYPDYDGTALHFAQIMLTEDDNVISSLLDWRTKQAIGGAISTLRQMLDKSTDESDDSTGLPGEQTKEPEEQTQEPDWESTRDTEQDTQAETEPEITEAETTEAETTEAETTESEQTTDKEFADVAVYVHKSLDSLSMVAGNSEIEVFTLDTYDKWNRKVDVTDPEVTHLKFRGWLAFGLPTPGTYGYAFDRGEKVYDASFSREAESMVHTVSSYMGGKSCSRMEVLIPIGDLAPGDHRVAIWAKSADGKQAEVAFFKVTVHEDMQEDQTEPEITDIPPEPGWSEGLQYTEQTQNGSTVYVVSGIGSCTDTDLYIPPTYQGGSVVAIGEFAFLDNIEINSVVLPSTVERIEEQAFRGCLTMTHLVLPQGLTSIGLAAFSGCSMLVDIEIPAGIKRIEEHAFSYCYNLQNVTFLGEVEEVGNSAFESCFSLQSIVLPDSVKVLESHALGQTEIARFVLPEGVTTFTSFAFYNCDALEWIALHRGVVAIEDSAFDTCEVLRTIYYHGTAQDWENIQMTEKTRALLTPLVIFEGK